MEPLLGLALAAGSSVVLLGLRRRWHRRLAERWAGAARGAGLSEIETEPGTPIVRGRSGSLRLRLELQEHRGDSWPGTLRVTVGGLGHGRFEVLLRREGLGSALEKLLGVDEVEIGDPDFDSVAYLRAPFELTLAVFDAETRRRIGRLLRGELEVAGGSLPLAWKPEVTDGELAAELSLSTPGATLSEALEALLDLGERLSHPADVPSRIARNAGSDPLESVRLAGLRCLLAQYPDDPATPAALLAALRDESDEVRVTAAVALGEPARGTLLDLATRATVDAVRARAVTALGTGLGELAFEVLDDALHRSHPAAARAAMAVLGGLGGPAAIERLGAVLGGERDELARGAAHALGAAGDARGEPALLAALQREEPGLQVVVAEALGEAGTVAAVVPLRELERRASRPPFQETALRRVVRQAIAKIQSRLPGASPGQLSLAGGEAGQLSLADDRRGDVELSQPEET